MINKDNYTKAKTTVVDECVWGGGGAEGGYLSLNIFFNLRFSSFFLAIKKKKRNVKSMFYKWLKIIQN